MTAGTGNRDKGGSPCDSCKWTNIESGWCCSCDYPDRLNWTPIPAPVGVCLCGECRLKDSCGHEHAPVGGGQGENELLRCPFCSGVAKLHPEHFVACYNGDSRCGVEPCTIEHKSDAEAIEAWNRRATTTAPDIMAVLEDEGLADKYAMSVIGMNYEWQGRIRAYRAAVKERIKHV